MWFRKKTLARDSFDRAKISSKVVEMTSDSAMCREKMLEEIKRHAEWGNFTLMFWFHSPMPPKEYDDATKYLQNNGFVAYEPSFVDMNIRELMFVSWDKRWVREQPKPHYEPEKPFFYPW